MAKPLSQPDEIVSQEEIGDLDIAARTGGDDGPYLTSVS